jgi:hypothetical protein
MWIQERWNRRLSDEFWWNEFRAFAPGEQPVVTKVLEIPVVKAYCGRGGERPKLQRTNSCDYIDYTTKKCVTACAQTTEEVKMKEFIEVGQRIEAARAVDRAAIPGIDVTVTL